MRPERAIYCVSDSGYFPGVVAAVNSLRLSGHDDPILLLDCGLTEAERRALEPEVEIHRAPEGRPAYLSKHVLPLTKPARTMLLLDADVIVLRPLEPLFAAAADGALAAHEDPLANRSCREWGELLDLPAPRAQTYVNAGVLAVGAEIGLPLFEAIDARYSRINLRRSMVGSERDSGYPLFFLDQDILNALLAASVDADALAPLPAELAPHPPFSGISLVDARTLTCRNASGVEAQVLHHVGPKPWLDLLGQNVYSTLLRRLLLADDLPLRVAPDLLPLRLRNGVVPALARVGAAAVPELRRLRRNARPAPAAPPSPIVASEREQPV